MKSIIAAGLLAALTVVPATSAMANVMYTFTGTSTGTTFRSVSIEAEFFTEVGENNGLSGAGAGAGAGNFAFTSGGDDLIGIRIVTDGVFSEGISPNGLRGTVNLSLNVDSRGAVTSSVFRFLGDTISFDIAGTGPAASGAAAQDMTTCTLAAGNCPVSGTWALTAVPEPMSIALFGAGLAGLALARRRKV